MSDAAVGAEACVYVVLCRRVGLVKIGVAGDARKRLRELQVGSPVELELALAHPYGDRRDAGAVAEELYRCFAGRRVRGGWYRLTIAEVREGFGRRATVEAPARAHAAAEAAARDGRHASRRGGQRRGRTEKQLAYERRRRQKRTRKQQRAARLLAHEMTQEAAAAAVGVTSRTLRNWKAAPAFRRERERQRKRAVGRSTSAPSGEVKAPARAAAKNTRPDRPPAAPAQPQPTAAADEQPSGLRWVGAVPLWGDSDGWPRMPEEHAARDAYYSARRDRSEADRYDYNTVVKYDGQTAAEQRAVRSEKTRTRERARATRKTAHDPS